LDFNKSSLETNKSDADKRIYNGRYCVQARKDVNPPFREAMTKAKETAASADAALKSCLEELVGIWDRCEKEHEKDIRAAEDSIAYFE